MEEFKTVTPKEMKFTWKEWIWGICAYLRFWNKKFRSPYTGMQYRQALILMRLRGECPATIQEVLEAYGERFGFTDHLDNDSFQTPYERVPYVHVGRSGEVSLSPTWLDEDDEYEVLVRNKD